LVHISRLINGDSEESMISPFSSPRVLGGPVFFSIFDSPSDEEDSVVKSISKTVVDDSTSVALEDLLVGHNSDCDRLNGNGSFHSIIVFANRSL
jgi:hypothetical protein